MWSEFIGSMIHQFLLQVRPMAYFKVLIMEKHGNCIHVILSKVIFFMTWNFIQKIRKQLYAITFYNGVYKSQDGGLTWNPINKGLKWKTNATCCSDLPQIEVDPNNGKIAYVLLPNRIVYRTSNEGESWQPANQGLKLTCRSACVND